MMEIVILNMILFLTKNDKLILIFKINLRIKYIMFKDIKITDDPHVRYLRDSLWYLIVYKRVQEDENFQLLKEGYHCWFDGVMSKVIEEYFTIDWESSDKGDIKKYQQRKRNYKRNEYTKLSEDVDKELYNVIIKLNNECFGKFLEGNESYIKKKINKIMKNWLQECFNIS